MPQRKGEEERLMVVGEGNVKENWKMQRIGEDRMWGEEEKKGKR